MYIKIIFYVPRKNRLKTLGFLSCYEFKCQVICQRDIDLSVNLFFEYRLFEIIIKGTEKDAQNFLKAVKNAKLAPPNYAHSRRRYLRMYEVMKELKIPH